MLTLNYLGVIVFYLVVIGISMLVGAKLIGMIQIVGEKAGFLIGTVAGVVAVGLLWWYVGAKWLGIEHYRYTL
jgi:hypothetical protein